MQCHGPFLMLSMVCNLLVNALQNDIVSPVNAEVVDKALGFFAKKLAMVQSIAFGEEQSVVQILVHAIMQGPCGQHHDTVWTMFLNIVKGMAYRIPLA